MLWNDRYLKMYRISPNGYSCCTREEMLEPRSGRNSLPGPRAIWCEAADGDLKRVHPTSFAAELVDGRIVNVAYQPIQNGGLVANA